MSTTSLGNPPPAHQADDAAAVAGGERFTSLAEMQAAHRVLLASARTPHGKSPESQSLRHRIVEFLEKGRRAGAVIDTVEDRESAQSLLDYWAATLYSMPLRGAEAAAESRQTDTVLDEFDAATVRGVAGKIAAAAKALDPRDRETLRRVALRLVQMAPEGRRFSPVTANRPALESLDEVERVGRVLDLLVGAGAVKKADAADPANQQFSLQHESLTREWPDLREWIDSRARFRGAVAYWVKQNRDPAALIKNRLLDEALGYHDLNGQEHEFIDASRAGEKKQKRYLFVAMVLFALVAAFALWNWYSAAKAEGAERQLRAAIQTRQDMQNVSHLVRTFTQLMLAERPVDREIAGFRWKILKENLESETAPQASRSSKLKLDQFIKAGDEIINGGDDAGVGLTGGSGSVSGSGSSLSATTRPTTRASISATTGASSGTGTGPGQLSDKALQALDLARQMRNAAEGLNDPLVNAALKSMRSVSYRTAELYAEKIVATLKDEPVSRAEPLASEFWLLYWGEMVIVESPAVERAMKRFGQKLREIQDKTTRSTPDVTSLINKFSRAPIKGSSGVAPRGSYTRGSYSVEQMKQLAWDVDEGDRRQIASSIEKLSETRATPADVAELRRLFQTELKPALEKELSGEYVKNSGAPAAF